MVPPVVLALGELRLGHPLSLGILDLLSIIEAASTPRHCGQSLSVSRRDQPHSLLETSVSLL